jgi:hypothetical protein
MNQNQTRAVIRALGLSAVRIDGEWRINYLAQPGASHDREATAYYTGDNADALATAKAMAAAKDEHERARR